MTPDKYKKLSRRSFDALVKRWKQEIASWDPSAAGHSRSSASSLSKRRSETTARRTSGYPLIDYYVYLLAIESTLTAG